MRNSVLFPYLFILFMYLFVHLFILFMYLFVHLFIYLFIHRSLRFALEKIDNWLLTPSQPQSYQGNCFRENAYYYFSMKIN